MANSNVVLIQFAKRPIPGLVKTRLIPALGVVEAARVHEELLRLTLGILQDSKLGSVQLWWDESWDDQAYMGRFGGRQLLSTSVQQGQDLGERMFQALQSQLVDAEKVVLVGSDCPVLSSQYLHAAIKTLDVYDMVLGPADDGGFVLIGASKLTEGCLTGIEWGVATALSQTREKAQSSGLSLGLLDMLWDVDVPADYQRWLSILKNETPY